MLVEHTDNAPSDVSLRTLGSTEFTARADQLIAIYIDAMGYQRGTGAGRRHLWLEHAKRPGFRCVAAFGSHGTPLGFAYGYTGRPGQWWHNEVCRGLSTVAAGEWRADYVEVTELHVRPETQGRQVGERVLRQFLQQCPEQRVLLSTPEGENRAWRLYRRLGFGDVLRQHRFTGDPRLFGILGRILPLTD
ncbi:MAG: GNAT family N-acetyltransferase [Nakamurella sp.]